MLAFFLKGYETLRWLLLQKDCVKQLRILISGEQAQFGFFTFIFNSCQVLAYLDLKNETTPSEVNYPVKVLLQGFKLLKSIF